MYYAHKYLRTVVEALEVSSGKDRYGVDAVIVRFCDVVTLQHAALSKETFFKIYERIPDEDVELHILSEI